MESGGIIFTTFFARTPRRFDRPFAGRNSPEEASGLATSPTPPVSLVPGLFLSGDSASKDLPSLWGGRRECRGLRRNISSVEVREPLSALVRLVSWLMVGAQSKYGRHLADIWQSHGVRYGGRESRPGIGATARNSSRVTLASGRREREPDLEPDSETLIIGDNNICRLGAASERAFA